MENLIIILLCLAGIAGSLFLVVLRIRRGMSTFLTILQFNLAGDGPTKRLFPNLAFLGLFLLLIRLTWF